MQSKPHHVEKDRAQFATSAALNFMIAVEYLAMLPRVSSGARVIHINDRIAMLEETILLRCPFLAKEKNLMRVDSRKVCGHIFLRRCHHRQTRARKEGQRWEEA
jgi:hypothetical protein